MLSRSASGASLEKVDFHDVPGYVRRLERSRTPRAESIRRLIQEGPCELARQREAARREGIPVAVPELRIPTPPPERNAAPIYLQLMRLLKERPLDPKAERILSDLGTRAAHTAQEVGLVQTLLIERLDIMDRVNQVVERPQCVFQRDWSLGPELVFVDEHAVMRQAARLVKAESYFLARQGRYCEAIAHQARGFRIAEHAASDPVVLTYLMGSAMARMALHGMEDILRRAGPDATVAENVRQSIEQHRPRLDLKVALKGEVVYHAATMDILRRNGPAWQAEYDAESEEILRGRRRRRGPAKKLSPEEERQWLRMLDAVEAEYLQHMRQIIATADQPYPERISLRRKLEARSAEASMSQILFATNSGLFTGLGQERWQAVEAVVLAGAALLAYKAEHHRSPDRLEQAMPKPPIDPFTGQPLKFRREGDGFVVYSVGPEGKFRGNEPASHRPSEHAVFSYPAPAPVRPPWLDGPVLPVYPPRPPRRQ